MAILEGVLNNTKSKQKYGKHRNFHGRYTKKQMMVKFVDFEISAEEHYRSASGNNNKVNDVAEIIV